jgi:hypothetical protein
MAPIARSTEHHSDWESELGGGPLSGQRVWAQQRASNNRGRF